MKKTALSVFVIIGTTVGGGMIALPAVTGVYSYVSALLTLLLVWSINIVIAFLFLEANCYFPKGTGLITMSRRLFGRAGAVVTWSLTLFFFYTLLTAYTVGMGGILQGLLGAMATPMLMQILPFLLVGLMGLCLYFGFSTIAALNQWLVIALLGTFTLLVASLLPHINLHQLLEVSPHLSLPALPIVFTSFGFLAVIPSLRDYLEDDLRKIKWVIFLGSLFPLVIYGLWITVVMGLIPVSGIHGLHAILQHNNIIQSMTVVLLSKTHLLKIKVFIQCFILCAIMGSFIGSSIGLFDCLADALGIEKTPMGKVSLVALCFIPVLLALSIQSRLFVRALGLAGISAMVLFGFYPVLFVWTGRYKHRFNTPYKSFATRPMLVFILGFTLLILGLQLT